MITKERAQGLIDASRFCAEYGPWCDHLDKVMTSEERKAIIEHWDTMSDRTSFVDALYSLARGNGEKP